LTLKRGVEVLVGVALWVVLLTAVLTVVFPAVAEAQEEKKGTGAPAQEEARVANRGADATPPTHVVVVRPGDSLWSISEEHLGPNATLQRIDREVERIYALNRERIGADPNLILSGQELLVPSVSGSSTPGSPTRAISTQEEEGATGSEATGSEATGSEATGSEATGSEATGSEATGEQAPERATLPELADVQPVPAARQPTSDTSSASSWPIGLVIIVWALLTVVLALVAWVLLTTVVFLALWALRAAEERREARKIRHLRAVFSTNYTRFDPHLGFEEMLGLQASGPDEMVEGNGLDGHALLAARRIRRARIQHGRMTRGGRPAGGRTTTTGSVYNPDIRRHLRRAPRPWTAKPKGSPSLTVAPLVLRTRRR
jgi:LysM repeat protein